MIEVMRPVTSLVLILSRIFFFLVVDRLIKYM